MEKITIRHYLYVALSFFGLSRMYLTSHHGTLKELSYKISELENNGKITPQFESAVFTLGSNFTLFLTMIIVLTIACVIFLINDKLMRTLSILIGTLLFILIPTTYTTVVLSGIISLILFILFYKPNLIEKLKIKKKKSVKITRLHPIGAAEQKIALKYIKKGDKLPHSFLEEHLNGSLVKRYYVMAADGSSYAKDYHIEWNDQGIVTRADVIEHKSY